MSLSDVSLDFEEVEDDLGPEFDAALIDPDADKEEDEEESVQPEVPMVADDLIAGINAKKEKIYWANFRSACRDRQLSAEQIARLREMTMIYNAGLMEERDRINFESGYTIGHVRLDISTKNLPLLRKLYPQCKIKEALDVADASQGLVWCSIDVGKSLVGFRTKRRLPSNAKCKIVVEHVKGYTNNKLVCKRPGSDD